MRRYRLSFAVALAAAATLAFGAEKASAKDFDIPTGAPSSPLFGARAFTQPMLIFEEFGTQPVPTTDCANCAPLPPVPSCNASPDGAALDAFLRQPLWPLPTREANATRTNYWAPSIGGCVRPLSTSAIEGRPPGEWFAHQRWGEFPPEVYFQTAQAGARVNRGLRDAWQRHGYSMGEFRRNGGLYHRGGTTNGLEVRFHPNFPVQQQNSVWTFDGTMPPKLLMARYGEAVLFRHFNALPINFAANNGFGAHTLTTHLHNGHMPAESDGFAGAFFFPGQFYDYRWPMILAGYDSINTNAGDRWAGTPDGAGGITRIRGDWRETQSTLWFHDHMIDYTAQNVYKGNAAMMNIYSAIDRGREGLRCNYANPNNPNLCFPSGTALDWGNRDYDVNLLIADKAWDSNGQLFFNIFNLDGFLGDRVMVNWTWMPYLDVRARRYRFRILNGSVSRNFKIAVVTQAGQRVPFHMIANDGNILEHAVAFPNSESQDLPEQAIAERYDIIIDFSQFAPGTKIYLVNLLEHEDGRGPNRLIPLADVMANRYAGDPAVGKFMEFRVAAYGGVDRSMDPADYVEGGQTMVPRPSIPANVLATARRRDFKFGRTNNTDETPWTIRTDDGQGYGADLHRVDAAPTVGQWEIWTLHSSDGWHHPAHIHFEEGRILTRDGAPPPAWERGARKDVYRIGRGTADSSNEVEVLIRFREFLGTYVEHCHNTQHEDHAMLLRWDSRAPGQVVAVPTPIPTWEGVYYEPTWDIPTAVRP
ncbi:MAG: multicopper oxidase domain-containing protein [Alphaproteobacteria bacterium]|nr:multicopper oxidase domain-containing protein [Alphaproteobacteria bacterium]